jgi:hypothetical protein
MKKETRWCLLPVFANVVRRNTYAMGGVGTVSKEQITGKREECGVNYQIWGT